MLQEGRLVSRLLWVDYLEQSISDNRYGYRWTWRLLRTGGAGVPFHVREVAILRPPYIQQQSR